MSDITQLRADFRHVFAIFRERGEIAETEAKRQITECGAAVQKHMHDAGWMQCAANHFREVIEQHERDRARSARIAAEVRAEREAKKTRKAA